PLQPQPRRKPRPTSQAMGRLKGGSRLSPGCGSFNLNLRQGPFDVGDEIGFAFEPSREAHQRVADAERLALLRLEPRMRRRRRMRDEALRIAEVVRNVDEGQCVEK